MDALSDRINSLPVSATLAMAAKARELKNKGVDIIGLSLGEPDFNTPEYIKDAAIQAVKDNYNSYSPVDGYADLKEAICTKFEHDNQLDYKPSQIVVSTGAKQSLANIAGVMLNEGDEVLLPCPYWVSYSDIVKLYDGVPVEGTIARGHLSTFNYDGTLDGYLLAGKNAVNPVENNTENLADGKALYGMFCEHCHGATGSGDGTMTHPIYSAVPHYNDDKLKRRCDVPMCELQAGHIFHAITYGLNAM